MRQEITELEKQAILDFIVLEKKVGYLVNFRGNEVILMNNNGRQSTEKMIKISI